jgi:hypothetical protein
VLLPSQNLLFSFVAPTVGVASTFLKGPVDSPQVGTRMLRMLDVTAQQKIFESVYAKRKRRKPQRVFVVGSHQPGNNGNCAPIDALPMWSCVAVVLNLLQWARVGLLDLSITLQGGGCKARLL